MAKPTSSTKTAHSRRSRAARRAASPSLNLDKSLKNVKPPAENVNHRPAILALHHGAGVTKKTKKNRPLATKKRKRQEIGLKRAELVLDKLEKKVTASVGKEKMIKGRRTTWDDLNAQLISERKAVNPEHTHVTNETTQQERLVTAVYEATDQVNPNADRVEELREAQDVALPEDDEVL